MHFDPSSLAAADQEITHAQQALATIVDQLVTELENGQAVTNLVISIGVGLNQLNDPHKVLFIASVAIIELIKQKANTTKQGDSNGPRDLPSL